jgi:hypothetical protein
MRLNPFKSHPEPQALSDIAAIRGKLDTCKAEIETAEVDLRRVSVTAILGEDPAAGFDAVTRLNELRTRKELLEAALAQALQLEADAQAALRQRDWQTRTRALRQHLGRVQRDAADVTQALGALRDAFRRLADTGQSIVALLPPSMRNPARPFHELLGPDHLRDLADVEAFRLSQGGIPAPGAIEHPARLPQYEENATGAIEPLGEILAEVAGRVRNEFDLAAPDKPSAAPSVEVPTSVDEPRGGEVVDLRSVKDEPASEEEVTHAG